MDRLRTSLCDLLGIEYRSSNPVWEAWPGRSWSPGSRELEGSASWPGSGSPPTSSHGHPPSARADRPSLRRQLWLHTQSSPVDPTTLRDETIHRVQGALNGFRNQLGIPPTTSRPAPVPDVIDEAFEVILEAQVPVWSIGSAPGARWSRAAESAASRSSPWWRRWTTRARWRPREWSRSSLRAARRAAPVHVGQAASREAAQVGAIALIPRSRRRGSAGDRRGRHRRRPRHCGGARAGAVGALLGTRFVATRDSAAADFWKKALLEQGTTRPR